MDACLHGNLKSVTRSVNEDSVNVNCQRTSGWTPLMTASHHGCLPVVRFLIGKKALINEQNNDLSTPLHFACRRGDTSTALILMEHGADRSIRDREGKTPWDIAPSAVVVADLGLIHTVIHMVAGMATATAVQRIGILNSALSHVGRVSNESDRAALIWIILANNQDAIVALSVAKVN